MVVVTTTATGAPKVLLISGKQAAGTMACASPRPPVPVVLPASQTPCSSPESSSGAPHRKRQRLTHLTPEEKAMRRKLKNRVAAQTARDRKKARMSELEQQVVELELENQKLHIENRLLREKTKDLVTENKELRNRLGLDTLTTEETKIFSQSEVDEFSLSTGSAESAAGAGPAVGHPEEVHVDSDSFDSSDSESDILLGILDSLNTEMFIKSWAPDFKPRYQSTAEDDFSGTEESSLPASPSSTVGTTSDKLEAINELIRFDHVYTKPLSTEDDVEQWNQTADEVKSEEASFCSSEDNLLSPDSIKDEPAEAELVPELGIDELLSGDQSHEKSNVLFDTYSDSGYEGSPSPFNDFSSPLNINSWDDAFASELFPQLISV